jgi:hypothetical protein
VLGPFRFRLQRVNRRRHGLGRNAPQPKVRPNRRVAVPPPCELARPRLRDTRVVQKPGCFERAERFTTRGFGDTRLVEPRLELAARAIPRRKRTRRSFHGVRPAEFAGQEARRLPVEPTPHPELCAHDNSCR